MKNLKIGSGLKKGIAYALVLVNMIVGAHSAANACEYVECSPVEYTIEFNVLPEYENDFKMVVQNFYNNGMSAEAFQGAYFTLSEYQSYNERTARKKLLNDEKLAISDFKDYSEKCADANDRRLNHGNVERNINLYNIMNIGHGIPVDLVTFAQMAFENKKIIKDQASELTPGGLWLNNNAGYTHELEARTVYFEMVIRYERALLKELKTTKNKARKEEIRAELKKYGDGHFEEEIFKRFDKDIYDNYNLFVSKSEKNRPALNNGDCMTPTLALIDDYLDLLDLVENANRMIPIILPENCNEPTMGMGGNSKTLGFLVEPEIELGRRVA